MKADEKEGRGEKEKEEMEERYKAEEEEWERSRKWQKIRKKINSAMYNLLNVIESKHEILLGE